MENGIRFDLEYETMPWHRVDAVVFDIGNILTICAERFSGAAFPRRRAEAAGYDGARLSGPILGKF